MATTPDGQITGGYREGTPAASGEKVDARRWNMERRNCYKGFGSFGLTKPPTTPVGVMRPVTPHSRQGCRQNLAVGQDGSSPSAKPIIFPNCN
jgi:hypothetical protein